MTRKILIASVAAASLFLVTSASASAYGLVTQGNDNSWGGTDNGRWATSAPMKLMFEHQYTLPGFDSDYVTISDVTFNGEPVAAAASSSQRPSIYFNWLWFFNLEPPAGGWPAGNGTLTVSGSLMGKGVDTGNYLAFSTSFNNATFDGTPPTITAATVNGVAKATTSPSVYMNAQSTDDCGGVGYSITPGVTTFLTMPGSPGPSIMEHIGVPVAKTLPITLRASDCVGNTTTRNFELEYVPAATSGVQALSKTANTLFTNSTQIDLRLYGPKHASEMLVSNEGSFVGASWEPYDWSRPWTITKLGSFTLPRTVYAKFRLADGSETGALTDDIIYDPLDPELLSVRLGVSSGGKATLRVKARDRGPSGLGKLEVKRNGSKRVSSTRFKKATRIRLSKRMWVRVADNAENRSKWKRLTQ